MFTHIPVHVHKHVQKCEHIKKVKYWVNKKHRDVQQMSLYIFPQYLHLLQIQIYSDNF